MYRCTECNKEYKERVEYCDCGNDTFEKIEENLPQKENIRPVHKKRKLTRQEIQEIEEEKEEKRKSLIAMGVTLFLCILVFLLPPYRKHKEKKVQNTPVVQNVIIPRVSSYWLEDNSKGRPLLNDNLNSISPELYSYLIQVGKNLNRKWNTEVISEPGYCEVEIVLDKKGAITSKQIIKSSDNKRLYSSVSLLLTQTKTLWEPPSSYKGERINILFSKNKDGTSQVSYP